MKKLTKRFSSLFIVMALLLSMIVPVQAAPTQGTITITQPSHVSMDNQVYKAYRVYNLTAAKIGTDSEGKDVVSYSYFLHSAFTGFPALVAGDTRVSGYTDGSDTLGVKLIDYLGTLETDSEELHEFGTMVKEWVVAKGISEAGVSGNSYITSDGKTAKDITINVDGETRPGSIGTTANRLGYFVILGNAFALDGTENDQTPNEVVTVAALRSNAENVKFNLKADAPTLDKKVEHIPTFDDQGKEIDPTDRDAMDTANNINTAANDTTNNKWAELTDVNIGDVVEYKLTSRVPNMNGYTFYTFIVHDKLSDGLTFNNDVEIALYADADATTPSKTLTAGVSDDYTVTYTPDTDPNKGVGAAITITFNSDKFLALHKNDDKDPDCFTGHEIRITYSATLNENAVIAGAGNPNKAHLEYSNNPYDSSKTNETPDETVIVYTYKSELEKYTEFKQNDSTKTKINLKDAQFRLFRTEAEALAAIATVNAAELAGSTPVIVGDVKVVEIAPAGSGNYRVATADEITAGTTIVENMITPESGILSVEGLDEEIYFWVEMVAPDGFNRLEEPVETGFRANYDAAGKFTHLDYWVYNEAILGYEWSTTDKKSHAFSVYNATGDKLPETGGIGRTIFTVTGACMMIAAAVVMIAKRKTREN